MGKKDPERCQQSKEGPKQNRSMVCGRWKKDKKKQKEKKKKKEKRKTGQIKSMG